MWEGDPVHATAALRTPIYRPAHETRRKKVALVRQGQG